MAAKRLVNGRRSLWRILKMKSVRRLREGAELPDHQQYRNPNPKQHLKNGEKIRKKKTVMEILKLLKNARRQARMLTMTMMNGKS
jgi:hypothetical protein